MHQTQSIFNQGFNAKLTLRDYYRDIYDTLTLPNNGKLSRGKNHVSMYYTELLDRLEKRKNYDNFVKYAHNFPPEITYLLYNFSHFPECRGFKLKEPLDLWNLYDWSTFTRADLLNLLKYFKHDLIKEGESLESIKLKSYIPYELLKTYNKLHTEEFGDTLDKLIIQYGKGFADLVKVINLYEKEGISLNDYERFLTISDKYFHKLNAYFYKTKGVFIDVEGMMSVDNHCSVKFTCNYERLVALKVGIGNFERLVSRHERWYSGRYQLIKLIDMLSEHINLDDQQDLSALEYTSPYALQELLEYENTGILGLLNLNLPENQLDEMIQLMIEDNRNNNKKRIKSYAQIIERF